DPRRLRCVVAVMGRRDRRVDRIGGDSEPFEQLGVVQPLAQRMDLVHAERARFSQGLSGNEEDRGDPEPVEHRHGELGLAAEPVVEGDDAAQLGQGAFTGDGAEQVVARDELVRPPEQLELRGQAVDRDGKDGARLLRRPG
ncbi:MAG: hypothetical protein QOK13_730, partial [Gaiellaceae bacterium]|nr:hypothetical protein [Gaiellaceae bacterium]